MTNNTDEFDQDQFDPMDAPLDDGNAEYGAPQQSFVDKWRNNPVVKLVIIIAIVGVAIAGALGAFSDNKQEITSKVAKAPNLREVPGGHSSQFFKEQNDLANDQRADEAMKKGGSALPTPTGHDVDELVPPKPDPMLEFRAETERLRQELQAEQLENARKVEQLERQVQQEVIHKQQPEDDSLAKAMQAQMEQLMESWAPKTVRVVKGLGTPTEMVETKEVMKKKYESRQAYSQQQLASRQQYNARAQSMASKSSILIPAGTVNYMQLLTEANSDVPGPILAQILSGPLAGGRAIGSFQVSNDHLVMVFRQVTYKGKDYPIQGLALDPDTTLGGMATEVDKRYLVRVVLPAAGAFMSAFGNALSETDTDTTVDNGTVLQEQTKKGMKEALYAGLGSVGQTIAGFFNKEAAQTKVLVKVAVGTPMGLFFLSKVTGTQGQR